MLRIKLVRIGKKDRPTWRIVVVERTKTGKGAVSDYIGNYNPHVNPKQFNLDVEKFNDWVRKGAQATDTVKRLKGRFVDDNKDYQKEVKTKIYQNKNPEAAKEAAPIAPKVEEKNNEEVIANDTEATPEVEVSVEEKAE